MDVDISGGTANQNQIGCVNIERDNLIFDSPMGSDVYGLKPKIVRDHSSLKLIASRRLKAQVFYHVFAALDMDMSPRLSALCGLFGRPSVAPRQTDHPFLHGRYSRVLICANLL